MRDADLEAPWVGRAPEQEDDDFDERLAKWLERAHDTEFAARALGVTMQALVSFIVSDGRTWLEPPMWDGRYLWDDETIGLVGKAMRAEGLR